MSDAGLIFELNNVFFNYPYEEPVLKGISFKVNPGEKICILGANGSGKSTLLKMLCGLIFPVEGEFKAFNWNINSKTLSDNKFSREYHRRVGFIFQNPEVQLFNSTVKDEVAFGPLQFGLTSEEVAKRVDDILHLLNINHLKSRTPFRLSGGEMKKVSLASVLVLNPEVLILDEPTNGLDPKTQRWLVELLITLNKSGRTIITSTHNLELVHEISNRCLVFGEDHKLAEDASTKEVLENIELLQSVNLVDSYYHSHGEGTHIHYHIHNKF